MSLIKNSQIFYINSNNRANETESNFSIKLDSLDPTKNYNRVVVLQADILKSYYLVSVNNNSFF